MTEFKMKSSAWDLWAVKNDILLVDNMATNVMRFKDANVTNFKMDIHDELPVTVWTELGNHINVPKQHVINFEVNGIARQVESTSLKGTSPQDAKIKLNTILFDGFSREELIKTIYNKVPK